MTKYRKNWFDFSYEIVDERKNVGSAKLGYVGRVDILEKGLYVHSGFGNKSGVFLECDVFEDGDETLVVKYDEGVVIVNTPEGVVTLVRLGLTNYLENIFPFVPTYMEIPDFKTDEEVNQFFFGIHYG